MARIDAGLDDCLSMGNLDSLDKEEVRKEALLRLQDFKVVGSLEGKA